MKVATLIFASSVSMVLPSTNVRNSYIDLNSTVAREFEFCGRTHPPFIVNVGEAENDGTGDTILVANAKLESDFIVLAHDCYAAGQEFNGQRGM